MNSICEYALNGLDALTLHTNELYEAIRPLAPHNLPKDAHRKRALIKSPMASAKPIKRITSAILCQMFIAFSPRSLTSTHHNTNQDGLAEMLPMEQIAYWALGLERFVVEIFYKPNL